MKINIPIVHLLDNICSIFKTKIYTTLHDNMKDSINSINYVDVVPECLAGLGV
jgi:hypothetical protein